MIQRGVSSLSMRALSFVAAIVQPGTAVEQFSGRTDNFTYGMTYGYSF